MDLAELSRPIGSCRACVFTVEVIVDGVLFAGSGGCGGGDGSQWTSQGSSSRGGRSGRFCRRWMLDDGEDGGAGLEGEGMFGWHGHSMFWTCSRMTSISSFRMMTWRAMSRSLALQCRPRGSSPESGS